MNPRANVFAQEAGECLRLWSAECGCSHSRQCRLDPLHPLQTEGSCTQQTLPGLTQTFGVWTRDSVIKLKDLLNQAFTSASFCRTFIFVHTTLQLVCDKGERRHTHLLILFHPYFTIQKTQLANQKQFLFMNTTGVTSREIKRFPPGLLYAAAARSPFEPTHPFE